MRRQQFWLHPSDIRNTRFSIQDTCFLGTDFRFFAPIRRYLHRASQSYRIKSVSGSLRQTHMASRLWARGSKDTDKCGTKSPTILVDVWRDFARSSCIQKFFFWSLRFWLTKTRIRLVPPEVADTPQSGTDIVIVDSITLGRWSLGSESVSPTGQRDLSLARHAARCRETESNISRATHTSF